ncbi:hypothetical protein F5884DRAFT_776843 [Xylogone sp. PMI_703]|nr:hypothetical protein F5884DRAFT_776843 [Xylogone sp. PMI_703]
MVGMRGAICGRQFNLSARRATVPGREPEGRQRQAKSTVVNEARTKRRTRILPEGIGKYSRDIDTALPGRPTRMLYDGLKRGEACVLAA